MPVKLIKDDFCMKTNIYFQITEVFNVNQRYTVTYFALHFMKIVQLCIILYSFYRTNRSV